MRSHDGVGARGPRIACGLRAWLSRHGGPLGPRRVACCIARRNRARNAAVGRLRHGEHRVANIYTCVFVNTVVYELFVNNKALLNKA